MFKASRAYKEYKASLEDLEDSDDDMGPEDDDAWLFEDLGLLLKLWMRKREKEQLVSLIFEVSALTRFGCILQDLTFGFQGVTAELLKDIITIFYAPLAQVYKAASIADSLSDLQNFLNDMIRTVEQVEEREADPCSCRTRTDCAVVSAEDPQRTVQTFIDLVQRHEQSFYTFVHNVHSKGQGLFDSLMAWIELFLSYARDGLPHPIDLEFILPHGGPAREGIMAEVDAVAQYHYKLKLAHEEKVRRRFDKATNAEASEEAALLGSVLATLQLSETAVGDAKELGNEVSDEEEEGEYDHDLDEDAVSLDDQSVRSFPPPSTTSTAVDSSTPPPEKLTPNSSTSKLAVPLPGDQSPAARRGSGHSGRSSLDKVRSALPGRKRSPDPTSTAEPNANPTAKKDKSRPPPVRVVHGPAPGAKGTATSRREAKKRAVMMNSLQPPETPGVQELRPLFVEVVSLPKGQLEVCADEKLS